MIIKNKRAGERVLSLYWILIFVIIGVGIVTATLVFFDSPTDIRKIESRILNDRIIDCITDKGELQDIWGELDENGTNLEEKCNLNFIDKESSTNQFYVEIEVEGDKKVIFDKDGSSKFKEFCGVIEKQEDIGIPICYESKMALYSNGKLVFVNVITVINKLKQNVK